MVYAIIVLVLGAALLTWSALTTCSFATFAPTATLRGQTVGPQAFSELVGALVQLPGIRPLEWHDREVLLSVLPTLVSMERGLGMFLVARELGDGVLLEAGQRLPIPMTKLESALRQVEREARMRVRLRQPDGFDGGPQG